MLKTYQSTFSILQKISDGLALLAAWFLSYYIRFDLFPGGQQGLEKVFYNLSLPMVLFSIYIFYRLGLYRSYRFGSRTHELTAVLKANTISFFGLVIIFYFFFSNKISRVMLSHYFVLSHLFLIFLRLLTRNVLRHLRENGKNLRHVLLIGDGPQLCEYVNLARKYKDLGISFIGWLDSQGLSSQYQIPDLKGPLEDIKEKYRPDGIIIGLRGDTSHHMVPILEKCYNDVIPIQVLPDLSYAFIGLEINDFEGIPVITFNQPKLTTTDFLLKRTFDLIFSFFGLLVISPLLLLIALLVKLTSKGPIFYAQERMGLDGKCFKMWKFRSMRIDAEAKTGAVWCSENDPRRTVLGAFLRASSLDELPQLWNVLMGDMSLVGPRPERPVFVEQFRHQIPSYMLRHKMKAGITGWAQINGWRGNTSLERRIEFDLYYIKNWSLFMDIKILIMTFWKGVFNKNAY